MYTIVLGQASGGKQMLSFCLFFFLHCFLTFDCFFFSGTSSLKVWAVKFWTWGLCISVSLTSLESSRSCTLLSSIPTVWLVLGKAVSPACPTWLAFRCATPLCLISGQLVLLSWNSPLLRTSGSKIGSVAANLLLLPHLNRSHLMKTCLMNRKTLALKQTFQAFSNRWILRKMIWTPCMQKYSWEKR